MQTMTKLFSLLLGCLLFNLAPAAGNIHALIMTIGQYEDPTATLGGVSHDIESARIIAEKMGVKPQHLKIYRNEELDIKGMKKAFDALESSIAEDDQIFIYYSGHGFRQVVPERAGDRCAEGLLTSDMNGFYDNEFESRLQRLGTKASKVIVLLDACHSGGATTRSVGPKTPGFKAKTWEPKSGVEACTTPVNVVKRSIAPATRSVGSGKNNFVYIAAARDNEVSLDNASTGGLATFAMRECMEGAAIDTDGSGALSAEEIRACAQGKINQRLSTTQGYLPHNITITGNSRMVLRFATPSEKPAVQPIALAQAAVQTPQPAEATTNPGSNPPVANIADTTPPAATSSRPPVKKFKKKRKHRRTFGLRAIDSQNANENDDENGIAAALIDLYENRDDRRQVVLETDKPVLKIGKDALKLRVKSSHAGFVYLLMIGSDDQTIDLLYPNTLDKDNRIAAGQTLELPRNGWDLEVQGPPGIDRLIAIVSDTPRDFSSLGMVAAGPFSMADVKPGTTRNLQVVATNASGKKNTYGADILEIEEVK